MFVFQNKQHDMIIRTADNAPSDGMQQGDVLVKGDITSGEAQIFVNGQQIGQGGGDITVVSSADDLSAFLEDLSSETTAPYASAKIESISGADIIGVVNGLDSADAYKMFVNSFLIENESNQTVTGPLYTATIAEGEYLVEISPSIDGAVTYSGIISVAPAVVYSGAVISDDSDVAFDEETLTFTGTSATGSALFVFENRGYDLWQEQDIASYKWYVDGAVASESAENSFEIPNETRDPIRWNHNLQCIATIATLSSTVEGATIPSPVYVVDIEIPPQEE